MYRKCKVASWAMNNRRMHGKTQREMADIALDMLGMLENERPDLVCFPEIFLKTGGDTDCPDWSGISREMVERMQDKAARMGCYVVTSAYEKSGSFPDKRYNCAILIGRDGSIVGKYRKRHPVRGESTVTGVLPGTDLPVFETDFGPMGMLICFDIGWRDTWRTVADKGAKLIVWQSAYDGGSLLNAYAAHNMHYVVSTVRTDHARVIDMTGRTLALSSVWDGLAMTTIDLNTELFHIDEQYGRIADLRRALGDKVSVRSYSEENVFSVEPNDPDWPMERIKREFGLTSYKDYHAAATRLHEQWRKEFQER